MIAVLRAANLCLALASEEGVKKAIEALSGLCDPDLVHAKEWLGGMGPISVDIGLEGIDKLVALIESIERVRPRLQAAVAAAKVTGALKAMVKEMKPEDVDKLKQQTEN